MGCEGCARCGDCCDVLILFATLTEIRMNAASGLDKDAEFMVNNWTPISAEEAERRQPGITSRVSGVTGYYECRHFDRESRLCKIHGDHPALCSGFPWHGGEPSAETLLPFRRCSYWHMIPKEEWPEGFDPLPMID